MIMKIKSFNRKCMIKKHKKSYEKFEVDRINHLLIWHPRKESFPIDLIEDGTVNCNASH